MKNWIWFHWIFFYIIIIHSIVISITLVLTQSWSFLDLIYQMQGSLGEWMINFNGISTLTGLFYAKQ